MRLLEKLDSLWFTITEELQIIKETYKEVRGGNASNYPTGRTVAATMYQAFGCVGSDKLPEGEWVRIMDWLSDIACGHAVGELLPVASHQKVKQPTVTAEELIDLICKYCETHSNLTGKGSIPLGSCNFTINELSHWQFTHPDQDYEITSLAQDWGTHSLIKLLTQK